MSDIVRQVFKYGIVGAFATAINIAVAAVCAATVWPSLGPDDPVVRLLGIEPAVVSDAVRGARAVACNLAGFLVANVVCWALNRRYVFKPGRYGWLVEYALFLAGSGAAILCGNAAIWLLVRYAGMQTTYSFAINVFISVAVNFIVRKFFVFRG